MTAQGASQPRRVLVDASNLLVGGGVQVAASLVDEFSRLGDDPHFVKANPWLATVTFHLSPEVRSNLTIAEESSSIRVVRRRWWHPERWFRRQGETFDLQFTVFGPRYGRRCAPITLTGIADGTSVYPRPEGLPREPLFKALKQVLRGAVSRWSFKRESYLVSESRSLLDSFRDRTKYDSARSSVVPNVVSRAVVDPRLRRPLSQDWRSGVASDTLLLAYAARLYPHKNHDFLPKVHRELTELGMGVKFAVTLTEAEWHSASQELRDVCLNVGIIPVTQIASLNQQCDAVIFPSLLESFSATPIEGLISNGVVFAADRPFVREVCGDAAFYFDPLDPVDCAQVIKRTVASAEAMANSRERAAGVVSRQATARDRAVAFCELITRLLGEGDV